MELARQHRKILHIHYYFPPVGTVGTLRNYNLALELSKSYDASYLITVKNKPFRMEEDFDLGFLRVFEVKHWDYRVLSEKLSRKKELNDRINAKRSGRSLKWTRKLLDSYPGNLIWGEGGWIYIVNALTKARKLIRQEGITHIYSSFRPMADHYIAFRLKKEFPQLIWIADFRDLPVDRNRDNVFFPAWEDRKYQNIFQKVDKIITVSEGLRKRLLDYNEQVMVLRNGLRRMFLPENPKLPDLFTITYTGSLYPEFQDPKPFFDALKSLIEEGQIPANKLRIVYAGKDHRIWNEYLQSFGLESVSSVMGKVSLTESIRLQHESHINLLLSWNGPHSGGVVTGKLAEYLAANRPILCLVNGDKDFDFEMIKRDYNNFYLVYSDGKIDRIKDIIIKLFKSTQTD